MENLKTLSKKDYQSSKYKKVAKPLVYVGILSIIMLFAGLTSAVIVRRGDGNWLQFELPTMFFWSTMVIIFSSLTLIFAYFKIKNDDTGKFKVALSITFFAALAFVFMQVKAYNQLISQELFFTGKNQNASVSFLYVISFLHLLHLIGGIIALIVVLFRAFKERYNSKNLLGLQVFSIYWHFMGGLWIYLYLFFNLTI